MQITCFDRTGKEVKRVTSSDSGDVEDPENQNQEDNGGSNTGGGSTNQGGNTGGGNSGDDESYGD